MGPSLTHSISQQGSQGAHDKDSQQLNAEDCRIEDIPAKVCLGVLIPKERAWQVGRILGAIVNGSEEDVAALHCRSGRTQGGNK